MATRQAKAERRAAADERLAMATAALAERFAVAIPDPLGRTRDPELNQIGERERMADLLGAVLTAAATPPPTPTPAAVTPPRSDQSEERKRR